MNLDEVAKEVGRMDNVPIRPNSDERLRTVAQGLRSAARLIAATADALEAFGQVRSSARRLCT